MIPRQVIEGSGEETANYAKRNPRDRFQLLLITSDSDENAEQAEGYSDDQFYADLSKAGHRIDDMVAEAIKEDEGGRTRKYPA